MTKEQYVEAWTKIFLQVMFVVLALAFLFFIHSIVVLFFVAIIITASVAPVIARLEAWRIPRTVAVLGIYTLIVGFFVLVISLIVPVFSQQVREFSVNVPMYLEKVSVFVNGVESYFQLHGVPIDSNSLSSDESGNAVNGIFSTTIGIFRSIFSVFIIFFLALYMSFEKHGIDNVLITVTPRKYEERVLYFSRRIQEKISQWMFGQLLLVAFVFVFYFIGLTALGIPYAFLIALFGAIFEMIPYVGPIVAAIPAILLGFLEAPWVGFSVIAIYAIVQQVQNHIVAPQVMRRTVGLNPVAIILALLIGAKLAGIAGILLAVPLAAAISVFTEEFLGNRKVGEEESIESKSSIMSEKL